MEFLENKDSGGAVGGTGEKWFGFTMLENTDAEDLLERM